MDPSRIEKCSPDDPKRCQEVTAFGQCVNKSVEGSERCAIHTRHGRVLDRQKVHAYRLQQWQERLDQFVNADEVKSLAGEIGILRMTLEQILNQIDQPNKFLIHSNIINDTATRIEKLVSSCDRLEMRSGKMLDKSALIQIAGNIVEIVTRHVPPQIAETIANEIIEHILNKQCQIGEEANG